MTGSGQRSHEAKALGTLLGTGDMHEATGSMPKAGTGSDLLQASLRSKPRDSPPPEELAVHGEAVPRFSSADSSSEVTAELWEESTDRRSQ